jgi:hypothetical protein
MVVTDYIQNGQGFGEAGETLAGVGFDPLLMRPYFDRKGRRCVTVNTRKTRFDEKLGYSVPIQEQMLVNDAVDRGLMPIVNAQTTLRKDEWFMLDRAVLAAARPRLRAWNDLAAASSFGGFDGLSKMMLEHERMTDTGEALVDMDGIAEANTDAPLFQLEGLPLPITHSAFSYSARRLAVSRKSGTPLDTASAEQAGRRVAEKIEKTLIGEDTGLTYKTAAARGYDNTPTVYGYSNHPDRITKTDLTTPTGSNPDTTLAEVLTMRDLATAQNFFGPFMLYHSNDWDQYMDNDYYAGTYAQGLVSGGRTLRERLRAIDGITDVRRLDYWTATTALLMVQMTSQVCRAVNGLGLTTVQWPTKGGAQINFRVMAIMVPQIRSQFIGTDQTNAAAKCGIVHATPA